MPSNQHTTEKGWSERFDEKFKGAFTYNWCCGGDLCSCADHEEDAADIKSFIAMVEREAYEKGRREALNTQICTCYCHQAIPGEAWCGAGCIHCKGYEITTLPLKQ